MWVSQSVLEHVQKTPPDDLERSAQSAEVEAKPAAKAERGRLLTDPLIEVAPSKVSESRPEQDPTYD